MKKIFFFCFFICWVHYAFPQYWMRHFGGTTVDEGLDIVHGPDNETFTTGYFTNSSVFGATTLNSNGITDIFLSRTDSSGIVSWTRQAGGAGIDKGLSVDVDAAGNVVATGYYSGSAQFGAQTLTASGQQDIFIAKYNALGNLLWVVSAGGASVDVGNCVKFDNSGNIFVTGEFSGTCNFGASALSSMAGSVDVFIAKYDANGILLWVKQGSGPYTDRGIKLAVDNTGSCYINGLFSDTITFDVTHMTPISNAKFLIKYDASGVEQWFRWIGGSSQSDIGGMEQKNNALSLTGSFLGTLFFFGNGPAQILNGTGAFNIFLCRFDTSGNLLWKSATGSANDFTATDVTLNSNNECVVTGNFNCRLTAFSGIYGDGTFCSAGFSDCFTSAYDSNGTWLWARQFGSKKNDFAYSISSGTFTHLSVTGSASEHLFSTYKPGAFVGYFSQYSSLNGTYCNDPDYYKVLQLLSDTNSSDIFINSNINLAREPLDFFERSGPGCLRPFGDIKIGLQNAGAPFPDTLGGCGFIKLQVNLNSIQAGPDFNYLWSNGETTEIGTINTTGYAFVTATSKDGCFSITDSIYIFINPDPPKPLLSDGKGVNFFATNALPVYLCLPDSVVIFSPNSAGYTVHWLTFPVGQNPVTVSSPGSYTCVFTDSIGCISANAILIIGTQPLNPIAPIMTCLEDLDKNDTIEVCDSATFYEFIYDSITNPSGIYNCIPSLSYVNWNYTCNGIPFTDSSTCIQNGSVSFIATPPGTYDYTFSAWVIRINTCDTDSVFVPLKTLHVIVNPAASSGSINTTISGPLEFCPGDTAMLIVSGGTSFMWNTLSGNDTLYTATPGYYFVTTDSITVNSFGCVGHYYGFASITISLLPQPLISSNPPGGTFCINDSLQLNCTGTSGTFQWQGPTGILPDTVNSVYAHIPGIYYCIQTLSPTCQVISNTLQISQITTPSYSVLPSPFLCRGDSAQIIIYADSGTVPFWYPPLFGADLFQTVYDSGTYTCEIYTCNTLYTFNIPVFLDTGYAHITATDTTLLFCSGDSIQLTGNAGMASYFWSPSGDVSQQIYIHNPGNVYLYTTNANGCKDSTSVSLSEQQNNLAPPSVTDTSLCIGDSILLQAISLNTVNWALTPDYSNVFNVGTQWQTPSILNPVTYYLFADSGKCKSVFDSVTISIAPAAVATITASDSSLTFCQGDSITLTANSGMSAYLWLPSNENTLSVVADTTGDIVLITTSAFGCRDSSEITIYEQLNTLLPPVSTDTLICEGESVLLAATGNQQIFWSSAMNYSNIISSGISFQTPVLLQQITYYLFSDSGFCKSNFDSVTVFVDPCEIEPDTTKPFVPNIFTPNGDGFNEFFPGFSNHLIRSLKIFNRWGQEIFSLENGYNGWDGLTKNDGKAPDGNYFYLLSYELKSKQIIFRKGYFQLLR